MDCCAKNIIMVSCLLWAGSAEAGFYIIHDSADAQAKVHAVKKATQKKIIIGPSAVKKTAFTVSSTKGDRKKLLAKADEDHLVKGFGKGLSFTMLAKQIIPKGWSFRCDSPLCEERVITWKADSLTPWRDVLNSGFASINQDELLLMSVDFENRLTSVSTKFVPKTRWLINGNKTLRENLEVIVKQSSYSFVWSLGNHDWEMGHTQYLNGNMQSVLDQIMQAYNDRGIMLMYAVQGNVIEFVRRSSMADIKYNKKPSSEAQK